MLLKGTGLRVCVSRSGGTCSSTGRANSSETAAAADKMHNLQPVSLGQASSAPLAPRNNTAILFNSQPVAFQPQFGDQISNLCPGSQLRKFTRLAVNDKVHNGRLSPRLTQPGSPYPEKPLPYPAKYRLHLRPRKINGPVERFKHLNRFNPRIGAREKCLGCRIRRVLIRQVFNRVAQDFDGFPSLRAKPTANATRNGRSKLQWSSTRPSHTTPHKTPIGKQ
jgi:hypothetical protein